jgi:PTS system mannose-specific IIB component/fructoselysine and glucoselysine-specific PTS system IIB component
MPIVLLRVDERLVHGQVVVGWGEHIHMERIAVVDDEISASPWEQELYCLGVPPKVDAEFATVQQAKEQLSRWRDDPRRMAVLLRDCQSLERLAEGGTLKGIDVNLGGLHSAPGRDRVLPYLFLSRADRESLKHVAEEGVEITARDLPASRPVPLSTLIEDDR